MTTEYTPSFSELEPFNTFDHDEIKRSVLSRIEAHEHPYEYISRVFDDQILIDQAVVHCLAMCGMTLDPTDNALSKKDPHGPEQTAFTMGALVALDTLDAIARENVIDLEAYRTAWTDSPTFIPVVDLNDSGLSEQQKEETVGIALERLGKQRYDQLEDQYKAILEKVKGMVDMGHIVIDQVPSLCYGFSFTLIGGRIAMKQLLQPRLGPGISNENVDWDAELHTLLGDDIA